MPNYRFHVDDKDFVLTRAEHEEIVANIKRGVQITYLRNNTIAINASFIRYLTETDTPTDLEQEAKYEAKKLPPLSNEPRQLAGWTTSESMHKNFIQRMAEKYGGKWTDMWGQSIWNSKNRT